MYVTADAPKISPTRSSYIYCIILYEPAHFGNCVLEAFIESKTLALHLVAIPSGMHLPQSHLISYSEPQWSPIPYSFEVLQVAFCIRKYGIGKSNGHFTFHRESAVDTR